MVNNTTVINATTDVAASTDIGTAVQVLISAVFLPILHRYFLFFATPFTHPEMWWLLIHLILTFVLFEFYFERHHDEDLGWTAALANSPFTVLGQIFSDYLSVGFFS